MSGRDARARRLRQGDSFDSQYRDLEAHKRKQKSLGLRLRGNAAN
jgi:hypothetical protein